MKIVIFYFSGTGITARYVQFMKKEIENANHHVDVMDITAHKKRQSTAVTDEWDGYIFGFPVYGNKIPVVCHNWLHKQSKLSNKRATLFFTYGGRGVGTIHQKTVDLFNQLGFHIIGTAEFLGAHSFNKGKGWNLMEDRPQSQDFKIARKYIKEVIKRFQQVEFKKPAIPKFDRYEYKRSNNLFSLNNDGNEDLNPFLPRRTQSCQMCYRCEENCANQAFNAESGVPDESKCISCLRCLQLCPDKAIEIGDLSAIFPQFVHSFQINENQINQKKSQLFF